MFQGHIEWKQVLWAALQMLDLCFGRACACNPGFIIPVSCCRHCNRGQSLAHLLHALSRSGLYPPLLSFVFSHGRTSVRKPSGGKRQEWFLDKWQLGVRRRKWYSLCDCLDHISNSMPSTRLLYGARKFFHPLVEENIIGSWLRFLHDRAESKNPNVPPSPNCVHGAQRGGA